MTKIKLCGMKRTCDIETVNLLRPDYVGFVFAPGKRRFIAPEDAAELVKALDPSIIPVGVFLNAEPDYVEKCMTASGCRISQVHGDYDNDFIEDIRGRTGLPVIQALKVSSVVDIERARKSTADWILLDNGYGGTGESFDWSLLKGLQRPYFLAGGLDSANVKNAINGIGPYAVDVSTGIETEGLKDPAKMKAFTDAVREANNSKGE